MWWRVTSSGMVVVPFTMTTQASSSTATIWPKKNPSNGMWATSLAVSTSLDEDWHKLAPTKTYGYGAARDNGNANAGECWIELYVTLEALKSWQNEEDAHDTWFCMWQESNFLSILGECHWIPKEIISFSNEWYGLLYPSCWSSGILHSHCIYPPCNVVTEYVPQLFGNEPQSSGASWACSHEGTIGIKCTKVPQTDFSSRMLWANCCGHI